MFECYFLSYFPECMFTACHKIISTIIFRLLFTLFFISLIFLPFALGPCHLPYFIRTLTINKKKEHSDGRLLGGVAEVVCQIQSNGKKLIRVARKTVNVDTNTFKITKNFVPQLLKKQNPVWGSSLFYSRNVL